MHWEAVPKSLFDRPPHPTSFKSQTVLRFDWCASALPLLLRRSCPSPKTDRRMMQPRPSDNQQRPILPALDALVPSQSTRSLPRDSVSGARVPVADDLVIGALSRSARIENISRELSSQAWSTRAVSREVLSSRHSRHWWRVDGRHDSIDDSAIFREQGMPAVGVFQEDIDLGLRSLLSTQVDVCPTLPGMAK